MTISIIAVPLKMGAAVAAEVVGLCVPTGVLDLILCKSLEWTEHQSTNKPDPAQLTIHAFDYLKTSERDTP